MTPDKKIPISVTDFKSMIDDGFYYIDKTDLIEDTIQQQAVLYTRPRRFGKTLNMSMLYYFYSIQEQDNRYLFDGLKISASEEAKKHQNQYPVLFLSFKDLNQKTFQRVLRQYSILLKKSIQKFPELLSSDKLSKSDRDLLQRYLNGEYDPQILAMSLLFLTECLYKHYGKRTVILIDEYDVPLNTAWENVFYDEMCDFFRSLLSQALKDNACLRKTILTGCLRISKESVFTGLNNLEVYSISDYGSASFFGFTQKEVDQLYGSYGYADRLDLVEEWYEGYRFGGVKIYNPWSTLEYLNALKRNPHTGPKAFWANTSGNTIVMNYIESAGILTKNEFQQLMSGESVYKKVSENLTFRDMDNPDHMYSFLLLTGYLKSVGEMPDGKQKLQIPNREVHTIYQDEFHTHFNRILNQNHSREKLLLAFEKGEIEKAEKLIDVLLQEYISFYDSSSREDHDHGFMAGLFSDCGFTLQSNREAGKGRYDLLLKPLQHDEPLFLLELNAAKGEKELDRLADSAAQQIKDQGYLEDPVFRDYSQKIGYGIAFYRKQCRIKPVKD